MVGHDAGSYFANEVKKEPNETSKPRNTDVIVVFIGLTITLLRDNGSVSEYFYQTNKLHCLLLVSRSN